MAFYSQGTQQQASADEFFDKALRWFGETELEKYKDPWAKGERLAALVKGQRTLLILDGLEPLQHPPGPLQGELSDPSLQSLLRGLSDDNPGLCLVTTREAVPDLEPMRPPRRVTIDLNTLDEADGAELLKLYGVRGSDEDLRQASADVDGHSLALVLLATYLAMKCGGDVSRRTEALLFEGHERYAAHAHKVMASYEAWFAKQDDIGRAAVVILRLMGLFNRPADPGCMAALRAEPPIAGLTDALFRGDRNELWTRAVERLRSTRLLADADSSNPQSAISNPQSLDAHPLVREHFAAQLDEHFADAAREAHRRLYEHLKQSAPELPDNLNDMLPLYFAVQHGCKAGCANDALDNVYSKRISRRGDFGWKRLGAVSLDFMACSSLFKRKWNCLDVDIRKRWQGFVFGQTGLLLRAMGRIPESVEPMQIGAASDIARHEWASAATTLGNLSETQAMLGELDEALHHAVAALSAATKSSDVSKCFAAESKLARLVGFLGREREARKLFKAIENKERRYNPRFANLYSMPGYWYCNLLRSRSSVLIWDPRIPTKERRTILKRLAAETKRRACEAMRFSESREGTEIDRGLDYLSLGRSHLMKACCGSASHFERSIAFHDRAIRSLRLSGQSWILIEAILSRAELNRARKEFCEADRDLSCAELLAERGTMVIWQIEAALERTRLYLALASANSTSQCFQEEDRNATAQRTRSEYLEMAREKLDEAKRLVKQTERPYKPHVPDWPDWQPPEYVGVFEKGQIVGYHCRNDEIERLQAELDTV